MIAVDVFFTVINYVPLPVGIGFWTGRGISIWILHNNLIGFEQFANDVSNEIQQILIDMYPPDPIAPPPSINFGEGDFCE